MNCNRYFSRLSLLLPGPPGWPVSSNQSQEVQALPALSSCDRTPTGGSVVALASLITLPRVEVPASAPSSSPAPLPFPCSILKCNSPAHLRQRLRPHPRSATWDHVIGADMMTSVCFLSRHNPCPRPKVVQLQKYLKGSTPFNAGPRTRPDWLGRLWRGELVARAYLVLEFPPIFTPRREDMAQCPHPVGNGI